MKSYIYILRKIEVEYDFEEELRWEEDLGVFPSFEEAVRAAEDEEKKGAEFKEERDFSNIVSNSWKWRAEYHGGYSGSFVDYTIKEMPLTV